MEVGVDKEVTNQRKFERALTCGSCVCCRRQAFIHISRVGAEERV